MRNRAFLNVVLLGLLTFALVPGVAGAASQGQNLTEIELASHAATRAEAVSAHILASPAAQNFGIVNVGSSADLSFTIVNDGGSGAAILNLSPTEMNAGAPIEILSLSMSSLRPLADFPGDIATLVVRFTPTVSGATSDQIFMNSNASNDGGAYSVAAFGSGNLAPVMAAHGSEGMPAFVNRCFSVGAIDPESDPITYSFTSVPPLPAGPTFDPSTGQFCWTPELIDVGTYMVTFCAEDNHGATSDPCVTIAVIVSGTNQPPVANPGGPYSGTAGGPIFFDGSGSSDPDAGQTLTYAWDFGDGGHSTDQNPVHTYGFAGTYIVTLKVTDNGTPQFDNSAGTAANIGGAQGAQVILKLTNGTMKLFGGSLQVMGLEPNTLAANTVDPASIRLSTDTPGAGSAAEIAPDGKTTTLGDLDNDGLGDLDVSFTRANLHNLLGNLSNNTVVNLFVHATTFSGATVLGSISGVKVKNHGGGAAVSSLAAPNPFNPETSISYSLKNSGNVTVRIFGLNGQLVRTLKNEYGSPGTHEVRWDGRNNAGQSVTSGIYFVKVQQGAEYSINKLSLLK